MTLKTVEAARTACIPTNLRDRLARGLSEECNLDAETVLLLSFCPNVITFGMEDGAEHTGFEETLLAAVLSEPVVHSASAAEGLSVTAHEACQFLTALETFDVVWWDDRSSEDLSAYTSLLQLPSLKRFRAERIRCDKRTILPELSSKIEEVCLHNSPMDSEGLARLLAFCPEVKSLDLRYCDRWRGRNEIDYSRIAGIFCRLAPSLRSLLIDATDATGDENLIAYTLLAPVQSLSCLTRLAAPFRALFDIPKQHHNLVGAITRSVLHCLPDSLKQLEVAAEPDWRYGPYTGSMDAILVEHISNLSSENLWQIVLRREAPFSRDISPLGWTAASDMENRTVLSRNGKHGPTAMPLPFGERLPRITGTTLLAPDLVVTTNRRQTSD